MIARVAAVTALAAAAFAATAKPSAERKPLNLPPIQDVNPAKYLGRWYQMYDDLTAFFETRYCVAADYGLFANFTISVRNRERHGSVTGPFSGILGHAVFNHNLTLPTAIGSLSVSLQGAPANAPYDIVMLGPETYGPVGLYEYAVVSDPFQASLFILARDPSTFNALYNTTVINYLEAAGYIFPWNIPLPTVQEGCPPYPEDDLDTCSASQ